MNGTTDHQSQGQSAWTSAMGSGSGSHTGRTTHTYHDGSSSSGASGPAGSTSTGSQAHSETGTVQLTMTYTDAQGVTHVCPSQSTYNQSTHTTYTNTTGMSPATPLAPPAPTLLDMLDLDRLLDDLTADAAGAIQEPANRAALVDAAIVSFTALDADENGQNGGAAYAEVRTPPSGGSSGSGSGRVWVRVPDTGSGPPPNPPGRTGYWKRQITLKNVTWVWRDDGPIPPPKHPLDPSSPVKPATDDIRQVIEMCQGDPAAERAIGTLLIQIANTAEQGFYYFWRGNKCFRWLAAFLRTNYPNYNRESGGKIVLADGAVVLEPLEVPTKNGEALVTSYNAFGIPRGYMTGHGIVRVTIQPKGKDKYVAYFDLGSSTHLGNYGGADHWFFGNHPEFQVEMNLQGAMPFYPMPGD